MSERSLFDLIGGFFYENGELNSTEAIGEEAKSYISSAQSKRSKIFTSQYVKKILNSLDNEERCPEEIEPNLWPSLSSYKV